MTLATAPEKALWVLLLYLVIQFAENAILVPRIQGNALRLHPVAVIVIVIISGIISGYGESSWDRPWWLWEKTL